MLFVVLSRSSLLNAASIKCATLQVHLRLYILSSPIDYYKLHLCFSCKTEVFVVVLLCSLLWKCSRATSSVIIITYNTNRIAPTDCVQSPTLF